MITTDKVEKQERRRQRIRKKISGSSARPRLSVSKTARHLYVQIIDDTVGKTLVAATTNSKAVKTSTERKNFANIVSAKIVGKAIAEKALAAGVSQVVFDRGGYPYHGVVKAIAEAAREAGLQF